MKQDKKQIIDDASLGAFAGLRRAATIIPLRHVDDALEVLLVKRHEDIKFAGGAYVFPGGRHDYDDFELLPPNPNLNDIAKMAAIRETFEETGYLLARDENGNIIGDSFNKHPERNQIIENPKIFNAFMKSNGFIPALDMLTPVAIWVPPEYAQKRYLTWFYTAEFAQSAEIIPDQKEIIGFSWQSPAKALSKIENGEINALFPTMANLSLLSNFSNFDEIKKYLDCKNMPLIQTKTIDKGINLWVETDVKDFYPYSTKQFH